MPEKSLEDMCIWKNSAEKYQTAKTFSDCIKCDDYKTECLRYLTLKKIKEKYSHKQE